MRRLSGQAARLVWRVAHVAVTVALTLALLGGTGLGVLAWRLARGPIALPWLTSRIAAAANRELAPDRLQLGQAALAWEGFRGTLGAPLDLRLTDVAVLGHDGQRRMAVPQVAVALSLPALLRLHLVPRTIALDRPRVVLRRSADGAIGLDVGPAAPAQGQAATAPAPPSSLDPGAILAELARPPAARQAPRRFGLLSQLHRLLVRDADLTVIDRDLGAVWQAPHAFLDVARAPGGGVVANATLGLSLGASTAQLALTAQLPPGGRTARVEARLDRISPAALAGSAPRLAPLTALDAPVGGSVSFSLGPSLRPQQVVLALEAGPGQAHIAGGTVPIQAARLDASSTPEGIALNLFRLTLPGGPGAPPTVLRLRGTVARANGTLLAALGLQFDQVAFARLAALWPAGLAPDTRSWILENIPEGEASDGVFSFGLSATTDLSHIHLFEAAGTLRGSGLVVHWLRPVPPLRDGTAELALRTPDRLDITVSGGRQDAARGQPAGLAVESGTVQITGLTLHDQDMQIDARVAGPLPAALALLREPRLGLLARHPMALSDPEGQVSARLSIGFPLLKALRVDEVRIGTTATLTGVHLARVVAGRNLDDGRFDLVAGSDGLTLSGTGRLGGIPARIAGQMDFRAGPPTQVQQHLTATAETDTAALAATGVTTLGLASGPVRLAASVTERRNGSGTVALRADLTGTRLSVAPLHWDKPPGQPARMTAELPLQRDRLDGTAPITLSGGAGAIGTLAGTARAAFVDGRLTALLLDRLRLGHTELTGALDFPGGGQPIAVRLSGPVLDLAPRFAASRPPQPPAPPPPRRGPAWTLAARFATVRLAGGTSLSGLTASGTNDGLAWQRLRLDARIGATGRLEAHIAPAPAAGRSLGLQASDAGALARGLGLTAAVEGGKLAITGQFGPEPAPVLTGTATLDDFRLRDAPVVAGLLQAATLYGVVELLRGPGLGVSQLIAPFSLKGGELTLSNARAFSPSLGATAAGRIDLDRDRIDLKGTIVPAYFFNSLLGHLPLVGRLFSPERGGGVFAASYALQGALKNPSVSVNPLAALTPGFLRGLFRLF